jgi:hypothetical protein
VRTSIQDSIKNYVRAKREFPMIQVRPLKRRRKEGEGRSKAWWLMDCSKLGGQWKEKEKFPLLGGQWNVKEKLFSPLPTFPLTNLFKPSIFSFDLEILLYHGPRSLPTPFLPFLRSINYKCASQCTKSFTPSLLIGFCLKI